MLTLDDAIKHCKEKAEELRTEASWYTHPECKRVKAKIDECNECAEEHEQLAEWLTELKELRERKQIVVIEPEIIRKAADALVEAIGQIDWNLLVNSYIEMQKEEKRGDI